ncbi:MAG: BrnT family toxin [Xanthobacteraceae bacterium]
MLLEWDEAKSRRNLNERGFDFEYAARVFLGPTLERLDNRREYGEVRVQVIGRVIDNILFVVYTDRGDARHIISARLASRKERRLWQSFAEQWKTSAE